MKEAEFMASQPNLWRHKVDDLTALIWLVTIAVPGRSRLFFFLF